MLGLGPRRRRRAAGRAAAGLAGAGRVRRARLAAGLALHRGHPHLPGSGVGRAGAAGAADGSSDRPARGTRWSWRRAAGRGRPGSGPYADRHGLGAEGPAGPGARYEQREGGRAGVRGRAAAPAGATSGRHCCCSRCLGFRWPRSPRAIMDTSTTSVNSALARARTDRGGEGSPPTASRRTLRKIGDVARVRDLVGHSYAGALERGDADALITLLVEDVDLVHAAAAALVSRPWRRSRASSAGCRCGPTAAGACCRRVRTARSRSPTTAGTSAPAASCRTA